MLETDRAFLSARVPVPLKNRFKSLAAKRGLKVQDLLNQLVEEYVEREDRQPPVATDVMRQLREHRNELEERGIRHLYLFGSVARGDARPDSDIDLAYELLANVKLSLFDIGKIEGVVRKTLATSNEIDLVPRKDLFCHVRETACDDEILVF